MTYMLNLAGQGDLHNLAVFLRNEVQKLAQAGADFGLLASNTPHIVFPELSAQSPIPLISIVEAACEVIQRQGLQRAGLLCTRFTMEGSFYPAVFSNAGIDLVTPDPKERTLVHELYMGELVNGIFLPETRLRILRIVDRMIEQNGIQGLVLGGTELPLLLNEPAYHGIPFFDTTEIHVEAAVKEMLAGN